MPDNDAKIRKYYCFNETGMSMNQVRALRLILKDLDSEEEDYTEEALAELVNEVEENAL